MAADRSIGASSSDQGPPIRAALAGLMVFKLAVNTLARAVYPFLPAIARGLGISLPAAGALLSIRWGASMGTPVLVATVGRRWSPAGMMVIGAFVFSAGALVTAVTGVFVGAVVGFILLGIAKPLFDIGSQTWISERVPFGRRGRALGFVEISWAGGLLVGAPLFGVLIDRFGWTSPFWVVGFAALIGAIIIGFLARGSTRAAVDLHQGPRMRLDRGAVAFLVGAGLMSLAIELVLVILGEWLEIGFGLTLLALGGIGTILGFAELVAEGGVLAFTDRIGSRRAMQIGSLGMAVGFIAMANVSASLVAGIAALTVALLLFEFGIVSALPLATELRPDDRLRFLSFYLVVSAAGRVLADLTGPALFARGGIEAISWLGGVVSVTSFVVISRWVRQPA